MFARACVIYAETEFFEIGDEDDDGIPDLMTKIDREAVETILNTEGSVEITISGTFTSDVMFEGVDTIQVIGKED